MCGARYQKRLGGELKNDENNYDFELRLLVFCSSRTQRNSFIHTCMLEIEVAELVKKIYGLIKAYRVYKYIFLAAHSAVVEKCFFCSW